jgi:hypothetical protein
MLQPIFRKGGDGGISVKPAVQQADKNLGNTSQAEQNAARGDVHGGGRAVRKQPR